MRSPRLPGDGLVVPIDDVEIDQDEGDEPEVGIPVIDEGAVDGPIDRAPEKRQVENARIALAHNGGGMIGTDAAATVVSILRRED